MCAVAWEKSHYNMCGTTVAPDFSQPTGKRKQEEVRLLPLQMTCHCEHRDSLALPCLAGPWGPGVLSYMLLAPEYPPNHWLGNSTLTKLVKPVRYESLYSYFFDVSFDATCPTLILLSRAVITFFCFVSCLFWSFWGWPRRTHDPSPGRVRSPWFGEGLRESASHT